MSIPRVVSGLVVTLLLLTGSSASARSRLGEVAHDAGLGVAAGVCTVVYLPIKVFISATGLLVGAATWGVTGGEKEPALEIVERTGGGDWIVTQQHLEGDRRFYVLERESGGRVAQRD